MVAYESCNKEYNHVTERTVPQESIQVIEGGVVPDKEMAQRE